MEEEKKEKPSLNLHLILDDTKMDDINDDIMEEACVGNDYNFQSKGTPKTNYSPFNLKKVIKILLP